MRSISPKITRRSLGVTSLTALTLFAITACTHQSSPSESVTSDDQLPDSTETTPVKHPSGLNYGTWLREDTSILDAGTGKTVLVEFLDYECPACAAAFQTAKDLREKYKGQLTFGIRHFPLSMHAHAKEAAYAAEAAGRQGKLEAMSQLLYTHQKEWAGPNASTEEALKELAEKAGLDVDQWDKDRLSDDVKAHVEKDYKDAQELGLKGTPTFLLNGQELSLTSVEDFYQQVEDTL